MNCAGRCGCSSVAQKKPVTKSKENSKKMNSQSSGKKSPRLNIARLNCPNGTCSSSETRVPLKDLKNRNILSVNTKCGGAGGAACKSTSRSPKVKCYSSYSVTPTFSLNKTYTFDSTGPSSYIREAFKNHDSKKTKKMVVSPRPKPEQTAFLKEVILVKKNFKRNDHHTIQSYAPVLKMELLPHYPKLDYDKIGFIFDAVPTKSVWKPSVQEKTTPTCKLPSNVEVVAVDGKDELFPLNFLKGVKVRIGLRTTLVDWLVKVRNYLEAGNNVLFMTIRIFDKLLAKHKIEDDQFQLYATTAFWICYKHYNKKDPISAPDLLKLTINRYKLNELLKAEKDILQFLNFKLHSDLQMCHVYSFVCVILKISDNNDIYYCSNFFLEILLLDPNCNCYSVSLQVCSSVYLALKLFNYNETYFEKLDKAYWNHKPSEMTEIHTKIIEFVLLMSESTYRYRNSFLKYSTDRYDKISEKVAKIIANL